MSLILSVCTSDFNKLQVWVRELKEILEDSVEIQVHRMGEEGELGQIVLIDASESIENSLLENIDRNGRAIFLIVEQQSAIPVQLQEGKVDDILIAPFRPLDVLSKFRRYEQIVLWNEMMKVNASVSETIQKLSQDLSLVERLQKSKLPQRFPDVKGFQVSSRYLAGMRSGGDHFDLAESRDGSHLSIVLSRSSSYGLSGAILAALMRVTLKLTSNHMGTPGVVTETVHQVYNELLLTLGDRDQLSLFYGTITREDQTFRFLNLGSAALFYAPSGDSFEELPHQGEAISKTSGFLPQLEGEIRLSPESRLALISNGFLEAVGSAQAVCQLLNRFREKEAADSLNEFVFNVKSKFAHEDDMPTQDCTAVIFDVDSRVVKLKLT